VAGQFGFELAWSPARVTERKKVLLGAVVMTDVAQDLTARGHRHVFVNPDGLVAPVFGAVHDKAELRLHRTTGEDPQGTLDTRDVFARCFQQARDRALADRSIDNDAECSVLVVFDHQDDGAGKARIADILRGDQQLPGQRRDFRGIRRGRAEQHRGEERGSRQ